MCRQDLDRRRPRCAHHLQAPSQATSRRPNASGVRLSSLSEYCVSSRVLEGDQRQRRPSSSSLACASARSSSRCLRFVVKQRSSIVVDVRTARKQALPGQSKKNEVTSRHRDREKENDQGEGSLTIDDHSTTWGRRREFADVLAGSVAVLKLLPGLLLGVASSFSWPGILRPSSILAAVVVAEGATASPSRSCYHTRARRKASAQSGNMEGKRRQNSTPELKERRR